MYMAKPSGQWSPVALGPLSGALHFRRSKLPIWPLAIRVEMALRTGQKMWFSFILPDTNLLISGSGQIVWTDARGQAGIHFEEVKPHALQELRNWLALKFLDQVATRTEAYLAKPDQALIKN